MLGALYDERTGLSFTTAAGPRQRRHYRVPVPRDSLSYWTVSDSRLPQPGGPGPVFISQEQDGPDILPGTGFPIRRPLDSRGYGEGIRTRLNAGTNSSMLVTLRLAVYRQSVRLGAKPFEDYVQRYFSLQLNSCGHSPYVTSSLTREWVYLLSCLTFCHVYISHI
jgi:hypothetical protein